MPPVERASAGDRLQLATDVGPAPEQVGAVLVLAPGTRLAPDIVRSTIGRRISGIPRLHQRLVRPAIGLGGPYWIDDAAFAIEDHVRTVACPGDGAEADILALAAEIVTARVPAAHSPWTVVHVTGLASGGEALVAVFHHVLADGIGGLAVLAGLVDGAPEDGSTSTVRPAPTTAALAADALSGHARAVLRFPRWLADSSRAVAAIRADRLPKARACSLNHPTGPRRAYAVARIPLDGVVDLAHEVGGTVNDVVLAAVGGALDATLRRRGDPAIDEFVMTVPVSGRQDATTHDLGNQVGVRPVAVPGGGDPRARLGEVVDRRRSAPPPPPAAASAALVGPAFRLLAHLHLLRRFVDRQRMIHTFVTNLRGPTERLRFLGAEVEEVVPVSATTGNVTVAFAVLSYAGTLTVTVVADPDTCPDLADLRDDLQAELAALVAPVPAPTA